MLKWGNVVEEGGLISWTTNDSASIIVLVNDEQMFNMLSDFHIYCHGRQQQNEQLNREAAENSLELQHILNIPLPSSNCSSLSNSPLSIQYDASNN